ncbi:unnamed protein product [Heligmosomoides polygyrus]|uniref:WWE domain-containing protein n=1 Tax=Heligmosomoides polygyrus TaxID=6339 RepID=A0A183FQF5_HELPZ|nr:unnamed protein product [Heligmosomoides polygyrus]
MLMVSVSSNTHDFTIVNIRFRKRGIVAPTITTVNETWQSATGAILTAARSELGATKPERRKGKEKKNVREDKSLYHMFLGEKRADNWRKYQEAKKVAKKTVAVARATHYDDINEKLELRDGEQFLYRLAKVRHRQTVVV